MNLLPYASNLYLSPQSLLKLGSIINQVGLPPAFAVEHFNAQKFPADKQTGHS